MHRQRRPATMRSREFFHAADCAMKSADDAHATERSRRSSTRAIWHGGLERRTRAARRSIPALARPQHLHVAAILGDADEVRRFAGVDRRGTRPPRPRSRTAWRDRRSSTSASRTVPPPRARPASAGLRQSPPRRCSTCRRRSRTPAAGNEPPADYPGVGARDLRRRRRRAAPRQLTRLLARARRRSQRRRKRRVPRTGNATTTRR